MLNILKNKSDIIVASVIVAVWVLCIILVNPSGDFPLNDDWAYGKPIQSFLQKGAFEFTSWPAMTLIGQILLGVFITKIFGFSFTVLRFFTLVCALVSIIYSYLILKKTSNSVLFAGILTIGIWFNPIFYSLSFTFMTDIPFYCFCVLGIYYNLDFRGKERAASFFFATFFLIMAVLIRQPAVIVALSFCLAEFFNRNRNKRRLIFYLTQCGVVVFVLLFYDKYFKYVLGYPHEFTTMDLDFFKMIFQEPVIHMKRFLSVLLKLPLFLGLFSIFLCPFVLVLRKKNRQWGTSVFIAITAGLGYGLMTLVIFKSHGKQFPYAMGYIINCFGLGPVLIDPQGLYSPPVWLWQFLIITGIVFFAIFFSAIVKHFVNSIKNKCRLTLFEYVLIISGFFLYLPIVSVISFFDRYLLLPLFFLCMLICTVAKDQGLIRIFQRRHYIFSLLILVPSILISMCETKDYLSWNRARWEGINYLMHDLNIAPVHIEGGVEFDGWYKYLNPVNPADKRYSWWHDDNEYIVGFVPVQGYKVLKTIPYQRLIPLRREEIVVSRKQL